MECIRRCGCCGCCCWPGGGPVAAASVSPLKKCSAPAILRPVSCGCASIEEEELAGCINRFDCWRWQSAFLYCCASSDAVPNSVARRLSGRRVGCLGSSCASSSGGWSDDAYTHTQPVQIRRTPIRSCASKINRCTDRPVLNTDQLSLDQMRGPGVAPAPSNQGQKRRRKSNAHAVRHGPQRTKVRKSGPAGGARVRGRQRRHASM